MPPARTSVASEAGGRAVFGVDEHLADCYDGLCFPLSAY